METDQEIARPVIEPVVGVARASGLRVDEPKVLGAGANVVIHLSPSPVVARVATLTAEMRHNPDRYLRRERDITAALSDRGVDVIAPTTLVDPGPHQVDDLCFLLMAYRSLEPVDPTSASQARAAGHALADLAAALAELPPELGATDRGHPWAEMATLIGTVGPTNEPRAMDRITGAVDALRATEPDEPWQLVHGDAHRVNVGLDGARVVWFDFEDANQRPLTWDLATLRRAWPAAGAEACARLGVDADGFPMAWHHELREVYALLWNLLYAQRYERARPPAAARLDEWLARDTLATLLARGDR